MQCAEALRVQALFDGELEALSAVEVERHLEHCPECRALTEELARTRARLRAAPLERAPPELRRRIGRLLDAEAGAGAPRRARRAAWRLPPFWQGAGAGAALSAACAAALAWLVLAPAASAPLLGELVGAHVRSLMPSHLTDVISTDRHTVKPWFAGHADVSPAVADFAPQGYKLVGGRADYFNGQRAAATVYEHGAHIINVFTFRADGRALPALRSRDGYHIACWTAADLQYCAVSDAGWDELQQLERLLRELSRADARD